MAGNRATAGTRRGARHHRSFAAQLRLRPGTGIPGRAGTPSKTRWPRLSTCRAENRFHQSRHLAAIQRARPIWAHLYDRTIHFADRGRFRFSLRGLVSPRIEPEIVLKLHASLPTGVQPEDTVAASIEWAAIGFEVVDSHYTDWRFTGPDAVADFGFHAALVVGTPWVVGSENRQRLRAVLESLRVTLRGSRDFVAQGEGRNALGGPLHALANLAEVLAAQPWAPPLAAGEIITTGTLTALPFVHPGESYRAEVEGAPLGALELELGE